MENYDYIKENLLALTGELREYSEKYSRNITLVAVTKSGTDEELIALAEAGVMDVGENRPQQLSRRGKLLHEKGFAPRLHEIGNLQRNKVKYIIEDVSLIHSLDSFALAEEIERQAERVSRIVPVLVEINSGREPNKGGIMPECAEEFVRGLAKYPHLLVRGLMTMGPVCEDPEDSRVYFRLTRELFDTIGERVGFDGEGILSMGMSDSYRVAIEEGSTLVRVGRRLFQKS